MSLVLRSLPYLAVVESQSFLPLCGGFGCLPEKSAPHVPHRPAHRPPSDRGIGADRKGSSAADRIEQVTPDSRDNNYALSCGRLSRFCEFPAVYVP